MSDEPKGEPRKERDWVSPEMLRGKTSEELFELTGVKPFSGFDDLPEFWPEEESTEDFLAWLDEIRGRKRPRPGPSNQ